MALLTRAGIIPVAAAGVVLARILPRILTLILTRMLARILPWILPLMRRRWRAIVPAIVAAIVPVIVTAVWWPVAVMIGRRRLPRNRGLHVGLAGSGHGHIGIATPVIAAPRISVWINLRGHKKRTVILLLRRAGRHYRRNNIACLRIAVLGGKSPVGKSIAL